MSTGPALLRLDLIFPAFLEGDRLSWKMSGDGDLHSIDLFFESESTVKRCQVTYREEYQDAMKQGVLKELRESNAEQCYHLDTMEDRKVALRALANLLLEADDAKLVQ